MKQYLHIFTYLLNANTFPQTYIAFHIDISVCPRLGALICLRHAQSLQIECQIYKVANS